MFKPEDRQAKPFDPFGEVSAVRVRIPTGGGKISLAAHVVAQAEQKIVMGEQR